MSTFPAFATSTVSWRPARAAAPVACRGGLPATRRASCISALSALATPISYRHIGATPVTRRPPGRRRRLRLSRQHFLRVLARGRGDFEAAEHPRDFLDTARPVERRDAARGAALAVSTLRHLKMVIAARRDLRQV